MAQDAQAPTPPITEQHVKRRAACEECRTKKLKCSGATGEQSRCLRCQHENITCTFLPRKQMGRPRKRQRQEEGDRIEGTLAVTGKTARDSVVDMDTTAFDMGAYESAFTPSGSLQPWLRNDWPTVDLSGEDGQNGQSVDEGMPGLSPDSSSSTPAMLGLQSDRSSSLDNGHAHVATNTNSSTSLLLDPVLGGTTASTNLSGMHSGYMPDCACLSTLYLTLNSLLSMDSDNFNFPFSLHPVREAMQTASTVLKCTECPKRFISGIQNTQLVGTLLMSIAERFGKVLEHIQSEAVRASIAGETKKFRLADLNTSTSHLHAGGLGCAAAFSINLSPEEWKSMSKKVVRAEVHGPEDGNTCCPYFVGISREMEERQIRWHSSSDSLLPKDFPRDGNGVATGRAENTIRAGHGQGEPLCLNLVGVVNQLVGALDWS